MPFQLPRPLFVLASVLTAAGVVLALIGALTTLFLTAAGVILVIAAGLWLLQPRRVLATARGQETTSPR